MTTTRSWCTTAAAVLLAAMPAIAHHSFSAEYDASKEIPLKGTVTSMRWANPHAWIYIDVETNGKVVNWALETGAANVLFRRGWRKEDLMAGTPLTVEAWLARNGTNTANAKSIVFADGKRLLAGTSNPAVKER
jgi:hypothetical protein